MIYDLIVVGSGASGILAALSASQTSKNKMNILLLEKLNKIGKKVLVSGNGRCNMFNTGQYKYFGSENFANEVLGENVSSFLTGYFEKLGLKMRVDSESRVYPASLQAETLISVFELSLKQNNINLNCNAEIIDINICDNIYKLVLKKGTYFAKNLVIACGACASPKHGSDGKIYSVLKNLGLEHTELKPALVPICTDTSIIKDLSGQRIKATLSIENSKKQISGELLFTDYGISGIVAMQLARFCNKGDIINIDLRLGACVENLSIADIVQLLKQRLKYGYNGVDLLTGLFSTKIAIAILKHAKIPIKLEACNLNNKQLNAIAKSIVEFKLKVLGNKGFDFAQVTAGGLISDNFNPITLESLIHKNLYCVGEILNVDGDTGGYNLMFAFKSGYNAGKNIGEKFIESECKNGQAIL